MCSSLASSVWSGEAILHLNVAYESALYGRPYLVDSFFFQYSLSLSLLVCAKYVIWQKYAFSLCRNLSWAQLYLVSWGLDKLLSFACQRHRWVLQVGKHEISTVSQLKYLDIVWDLGKGHDL
jgi:hypothetical protein